jgi:hypothetical protein
MVEFSLKGKESNTGYHIAADFCVFESLSENTLHNEITVKGIFTTTKDVILYFTDLNNQKSDKDILLNFGITNVHKIPITSVESDIGVISLINHEGIEEKQKYMEVFKTALVTSSIRIVTKIQDDQTLDNLVTNAKEVVEDFLKITSFSQGVLHDWTFLSVYINDMNPDIIQYQILRSPVLKAPSFKLLMPYVYSNEFVQASFKGYFRDLDEKYGFNSALDWYLESNADTPIETNFLDATTCLELLTDKLLSERKMDKILNDEDFKTFYEEICKSADSILRKLDMDKKTIEAVKSSLKQAQRMSFANKIRSLINYWGRN